MKKLLNIKNIAIAVLIAIILLEYFNPGVIEDDGTAMAVIPMNMEYTFTNEFCDTILPFPN